MPTPSKNSTIYSTTMVTVRDLQKAPATTTVIIATVTENAYTSVFNKMQSKIAVGSSIMNRVAGKFKSKEQHSTSKEIDARIRVPIVFVSKRKFSFRFGFVSFRF